MATGCINRARRRSTARFRWRPSRPLWPSCRRHLCLLVSPGVGSGCSTLLVDGLMRRLAGSTEVMPTVCIIHTLPPSVLPSVYVCIHASIVGYPCDQMSIEHLVSVYVHSPYWLTPPMYRHPQMPIPTSSGRVICGSTPHGLQRKLHSCCRTASFAVRLYAPHPTIAHLYVTQ